MIKVGTALVLIAASLASTAKRQRKRHPNQHHLTNYAFTRPRSV